jgi:hypothetical protein
MAEERAWATVRKLGKMQQGKEQPLHRAVDIDQGARKGAAPGARCTQVDRILPNSSCHGVGVRRLWEASQRDLWGREHGQRMYHKLVIGN